MILDIAEELRALEQMTVGELQERYVEVFGEPVRSRHRQYLIRRIAWRLQAHAEGGLSERALQRAGQLANVADVRLTPPRSATVRARGGSGQEYPPDCASPASWAAADGDQTTAGRPRVCCGEHGAIRKVGALWEGQTHPRCRAAPASRD